MRLVSKSFALPLAFVVLLPGCVSVMPSGGVDRSIDAPYDFVFEATVVELRSRGFSLTTVDSEEGRIVTARRSRPFYHSARPVETVEAHLDREGPETTDLRLYFTFVDQVSEAPKPPPDDGDDDRVDDVLSAVVDRSLEAGAVYDAYLDAIEARAEARRGPPES